MSRPGMIMSLMYCRCVIVLCRLGERVWSMNEFRHGQRCGGHRISHDGRDTECLGLPTVEEEPRGYDWTYIILYVFFF